VRYFRRLYDWVLHWAETPYGLPALFLLALAEASFFPIPPDILLIVLSLSLRRRAFVYASVCTAGSVIGGLLGFYIGHNFWTLGKEIILNYVDEAAIEAVRRYFIEYEAWAVSIAGFTPIPYKVFTISAGFFRVNLPVFITASLLSRGARFFLISGLIYIFGERIKTFIDRYFNILSYAFILLLIGGFVIIKYLL